MNFKKLMCLTVAIIIFTIMVNGCGKKDESAVNYEEPLTYWVSFNSAALGVENFENLPPMKKLMERTGVNLKFLHPISGMESEQFNVMIASGDYPDIIEEDFKNYRGGPEQAINDNVIISLNEVIEKYSPNFKEFMKNNPEMEKMTITDNGIYYTYPAIYGDEYLQVYRGPIIRKDLLDKTGLDMPETIDDWTVMLNAFQKMGIDSPLILTLSDSYAFIQAFGVINDLYVDQGKIKYGIVEPGFKEGISLLADWYSKGLIDRNIASTDAASVKTAIINGMSATTVGATGGGIGTWMRAMAGDDTFDLEPASYPVLKNGERPFYGHRINPVWPEEGASISTSCKNIKAAAKVLDYAYSEEGILLFNFGIEGESYEMIDDYPTYTSLVTHDASGRAMGEMISYYARPNGVGPSIRDKRYMEQYASLPQQKRSIEIWSQTDAKQHLLPPITLNQEENDEVTAIKSNLDSYVNAELLKFITGVRKKDELDDFVATVNGMGVGKYVQAYQNAYDRYLNR